MKNLFLALSIIMAGSMLFSSCEDEARHQSNNRGNNNAADLKIFASALTELAGSFELAANDKIAYENMVIYPVAANNTFINEHKDLGDYKTLKQGVESGKLIISEKEELPGYASQPNANTVVGNNTFINSNTNRIASQEQRSSSGPDVNNLSVQNKGDDTVFIMAGELVRGGNQDRVVAEDIVMLPHSGKQDLPVFCVEHGRWTNDGYYQNNTMFGFTNNVVSSSIKKIVVREKMQQAVWDKVADVTTTNSAISETGTYNSLENSKEFTNRRDQYVKAFENKFENKNNIIGVIVTDKKDHVIGCDIFCKPELFREEFKALIYSYTTEIISEEKKKEEKETISPMKYFLKIKQEYKSVSGKKLEGGRFVYRGKVIHYAGF